MTSNIGTTGVVLPPSAESPMQKFVRKFKQEPLVPIGAGLTTMALIMASIKLSKGDSKRLNYWLRARLIFQGLTIAAVVGGTYMYGQTKQQKEEQARREAMQEDYEKVKDRRAFEDRLKAAEEIHAAETQYATASSASGAVMSDEKQGAARTGLWGLLGLGKTHTPIVTSQDAPSVPNTARPPPVVAESPTLVAAESKPSSPPSGFWGRLGWEDSSSDGSKKD